MKRRVRPNKLRVLVRALTAKEAQTVADFILKEMTPFSDGVGGPVPLPKRLGSLHYGGSDLLACDKRRYDNIEVHTRLVDFVEPASDFLETLQQLNLPSSVIIEFRQF